MKVSRSSKKLLYLIKDQLGPVFLQNIPDLCELIENEYRSFRKYHYPEFSTTNKVFQLIELLRYIVTLNPLESLSLIRFQTWDILAELLLVFNKNSIIAVPCYIIFHRVLAYDTKSVIKLAFLETGFLDKLLDKLINAKIKITENTKQFFYEDMGPLLNLALLLHILFEMYSDPLEQYIFSDNKNEDKIIAEQFSRYDWSLENYEISQSEKTLIELNWIFLKSVLSQKSCWVSYLNKTLRYK